ncbi:MAG: caspase family protein [Saprospiraceae bacterium]|nr:caspase family protein [Saprospiraceae bacterium]
MKGSIIFSLVGIFFSINCFSQCLSGDCKNGTGVYLFPSGAKYEGEFLNGEINGFGKCTFKNGSVYIGNWKNRFPEGFGAKTLADGTTWSGNWHIGVPIETPDSINNTQNSAQIIASSDGASVQSGCLDGDCKNGLGTYAYPDGSKYEGNFKNGNIEGEGKWYYPNGVKYYGSFMNGQPHGKGALLYIDGTTQEGVWEKGEFKGNIDDSVSEGCIQGDCANGTGTYVYKNAVATYKGDFEDGLPNGEGIIEYANGEKYDGEWTNGYFDGEGTLTTKEGNVIEGLWLEGSYVGNYSQFVDSTSSADPQVLPEISITYKPTSKVWAVIIGVSVYNHMPVLKYSDDDAYRIYAFMKSPEGGALPDEQISVLIDEDATKANILKTLSDVFMKADSSDLVLLYFSGHGLNGCFLPIDYDGYDNKLYHDDIYKILLKSPAKHKLCIADACHSGSFLAEKGSTQGTLEKYYHALSQADGGIALLLSSKSEETSLESNGLRQGVFTHFLIRGMKGEADENKDKIITIKELYKFVSFQVSDFTMRNQSPILVGKYDANMPIAVLRN